MVLPLHYPLKMPAQKMDHLRDSQSLSLGNPSSSLTWVLQKMCFCEKTLFGEGSWEAPNTLEMM